MHALCLALVFFTLSAAGLGRDPVRFGIVLDGPSEKNAQLVETYQVEILAVLEGEFEALFFTSQDRYSGLDSRWCRCSGRAPAFGSCS